ncbi:TIGR02391 family protein [Myxococcus faecalis]|uniref:TIGR02391 family protein n=1 Tax=Myxococcus faecalis TaxID=3115646 RepID=UPI003CEA0518
MAIERLDTATLEALCGVLGDTGGGLTGSEIGGLLRQCQIDDVAPGITKRHRLYEALAARQQRDGVANNVLAFVQAAMHPARYVGKSQLFAERQAGLNAVLSLGGLGIDDQGQVVAAQRARTASEAEARAGRLRAELVRRQVHADVLKACRAELLEENYFHAVLEATKSVAEKVRQLSGLTLDGSELVDEAFGMRDRDRRSRTPILALNTLRSISEQSEQRCMTHMMKGIFAVFRNPTAHELKARWAVDEQEALDLLTMVPVVHRRLEGAVRVPGGGR